MLNNKGKNRKHEYTDGLSTLSSLQGKMNIRFIKVYKGAKATRSTLDTAWILGAF